MKPSAKVGQWFDDQKFENICLRFVSPAEVCDYLLSIQGSLPAKFFFFFCFHQRNGNQIGNFRKMLWEHAFAIMFWETQILLVWLSLCLWSWYNDFPCDSEMWSSLFGALRLIDHSPTLYTQRNTEQNRSEPQSAHIEDEKEPSSAMLIPASEK